MAALNEKVSSVLRDIQKIIEPLKAAGDPSMVQVSKHLGSLLMSEKRKEFTVKKKYKVKFSVNALAFLTDADPKAKRLVASAISKAMTAAMNNGALAADVTNEVNVILSSDQAKAVGACPETYAAIDRVVALYAKERQGE